MVRIASYFGMLCSALIAVVMMTENLSSFLLGIAPVVFQSLILARYFTLPSFLCLLVVIVATLIFFSLFSAVDASIIAKNVLEDIIARYPGSKFEQGDISDYINIAEFNDLEGTGYQKFLFGATSKLHAANIYKNIKLIYVSASEKLLPGGQSYRSSYVSPSFVFVNPSKNPLMKFALLHELGHSALKSGAIINEILMIRTVYLSLVILIPVQVKWSPLSVFLVVLLLLQMYEYFGYNVQDKVRLARMQSEIYADKFACMHLSDAERKYVLKFLQRGYFCPDPKFSFSDHMIREAFLRDSLEAGDKQFESWLGWNVGSILQKVIVMCIIALVFTKPPTYGTLFWGCIATAILYSIWAAITVATRQDYHKIFARFGASKH